MVGQTLTVKGRLYRYYRCRQAYDRNTGRNCSARYVSADKLETGIWREVERILTEPRVVLGELERGWDQEVDADEVTRLRSEHASAAEREKRLVRLYAYGEINEEMVREEAEDLRRRQLRQSLTFV